MELRFKIEEDLLPGIVDGDFEIGPAYEGEFTLLIESAPGHWIERPLTGVGLPSQLNGPGSNALAIEARTREVLEAEGWTVRSVRMLTTGRLDVDADPPLRA